MDIKKLIKESKFSRFLGNVSLCNYSVAVYITAENNRLLVVRYLQYDLVENYAILSKDDYFDIAEDPYNSLVELKAGFKLCGLLEQF